MFRVIIIGMAITSIAFAKPVYLECSTTATRIINDEAAPRTHMFDIAVDEDDKTVTYTPTYMHDGTTYQSKAIYSASSILFTVVEQYGMKEIFTINRSTLNIVVDSEVNMGNQIMKGSTFQGKCVIKNIQNKI